MFHAILLLLVHFAGTPSLAAPSESVDQLYNLAIDQARDNDFGSASENLLRSISKEPNPITVWENISILENFQRRLGIHESATSSKLSRISLLSNSSLRALIILALLWSIVLYFYFSFRRGVRSTTLILTSLFFILLWAVDTAACYQSGSFGILVSKDEKEISIYRTNELGEAMITLPKGSVVTGKSNGSLFHLREPIAGWIALENVLPIVEHPFQ